MRRCSSGLTHAGSGAPHRCSEVPPAALLLHHAIPTGPLGNTCLVLKAKGKPHAGAHRPLHAKPTRRLDMRAERCQHCKADVSGVAQEAVRSYDHIEIPEIKPDITRVTLHGGICPCCTKHFKAEAPSGLEPGSPFGPNLRAFVLYLRYTHAISFERLSRLCSDMLGLEVSEGALVNICATSRPAFATQVDL